MSAQRRGPAAVAAMRLGCTEGQLYTMVVGLVIALLLAVPGIPAVLRDRPLAGLQPLAVRPSAGEPSAATPPTSVVPPQIAVRGKQPVALPRPSADSGSSPVAPPTAGSPRKPSSAGTVGVFARVDQPGAPGGLAVGRDGTVFVTTDNGTERGGRGPSRIFAYDAAGTETGDQAITDQSDDRDGGLSGVAVDPTGRALAVLDADGRRVLRVDMASGVQSVLTEIPDLPACLPFTGTACQQGVTDRRPSAVSAAYDGAGNLFFTDPAQDTIWRLTPGASAPDAWYQSPDLSAGDGPFGLNLRAATVTFTVGASNDVATLGAGAVYRVRVGGDGSPGDRSLVHAFGRGDRPGSLAVAKSGTIHVVLRGTGTIVTLASDGSERGRLDPPGTGPIPLDSPSAIVLVEGALLVANGWDSDDPDRWAVLTVPVDDPKET